MKCGTFHMKSIVLSWKAPHFMKSGTFREKRNAFHEKQHFSWNAVHFVKSAMLFIWKAPHFWFTQWEYPDKAKEKHMKSTWKAPLSERPLARNCNPMLFIFVVYFWTFFGGRRIEVGVAVNHCGCSTICSCDERYGNTWCSTPIIRQVVNKNPWVLIEPISDPRCCGILPNSSSDAEL